MAENTIDTIAETVANTARDAFYVGVGAGVIAVQKLQVQRVELSKTLTTQFDDAKVSFDNVSDLIDDRVKLLEERLSAVEGRLENVLAQIEEKLPEQARGLVKQARELVTNIAA